MALPCEAPNTLLKRRCYIFYGFRGDFPAVRCLREEEFGSSLFV